MRAGVIYGGISREREISLRSGVAVANALRSSGYDVVDIVIEDEFAEKIASAKIDAAFITLHGRFGEDGTVQGLLELMGIPYTGSSCEASAIAMDKVMTKRLWAADGISTPSWQVLHSIEEEFKLPLPAIVKPPNEGSTIGLSRVLSKSDIIPALEKALAMDSTALAEQMITGPEYSVALDETRVFTPVEIRPRSGFYDFDSKYSKGATEYILPAACTPETMQKMKEIARRAYNSIGCSGIARVDVLADNNVELFAIEINTVPGMTETSLVPKMAQHDGIPFNELVASMIKNARVHIRR